MAEATQKPVSDSNHESNMDETVMTLTKHSAVISADPAFYSFLGFDQEAVLDINLSDLSATAQDADTLIESLKSVDPSEFVLNFRTHQGSIVQFWAHVKAGTDENTRILDLKFVGEKKVSLEHQKEELFQGFFENFPDPALIWHKEAEGDIRLLYANPAAEILGAGRIKDHIGLLVEDFFLDEAHNAEYIKEAFTSVPVRRIEFPTVIGVKGEEKWVSADYVKIKDDYVFHIIRDITETKKQKLAEENSRWQIEMLRQAMTAFTSVLNLEQVLAYVLEYLRRLIPYDRAILYLLNRDVLEIKAVSGFPDEKAMIGRTISVHNPQYEAINRNRFPLYLSNAEDYKPFQELGDLNCGKSWLGVPLFSLGQVSGFLSIYSRGADIYTADEASLAQTFASEASIAIENARLFQQVQQIAVTDSLTGLYNRRYFYELAEIELRRARRYSNNISLIILDFDNFKQVNDKFGHTTGDQVLVNLAICMRAAIRETDILGRYGGEEFVILLPETDLEASIEVADRLRQTIENCQTESGGELITVTTSLGVSAMDENCQTLDELISRADKALYIAKQGGRNRVHIWKAD